MIRGRGVGGEVVGLRWGSRSDGIRGVLDEYAGRKIGVDTFRSCRQSFYLERRKSFSLTILAILEKHRSSKPFCIPLSSNPLFHASISPSPNPLITFTPIPYPLPSQNQNPPNLPSSFPANAFLPSCTLPLCLPLI